MRKTKLHEWHVSAGARMTGFSGWDMPVLYPTGPREEHLRVRSAAGIFDIDHMGRFLLSGSGALTFLQGVQTWDAERIGSGRAHYSLLCNESGGILDDIFIYHLEDAGPIPGAVGGKGAAAVDRTEWLVVVNAGNRDKDFNWLSSRAGPRAEVLDVSGSTCMVALQGPAARAILQGLADTDLAAIGHHRVTVCSVAGARCILCTTGYTGEPGFEIMISAERAKETWQEILSAGAPRGLIPCGLAARDSLRAEACLPLYGHEIGEDTDPYCAGLDKSAVAIQGHEFIGKTALLALSQTLPARTLVGLQMEEPAVPRQGYPVAFQGRRIGRVTTGLFSPSTGLYLAMGYVERELAAVGQRLDVVVREEPKAARIVERPFYRSPHWEKRPRAG